MVDGRIDQPAPDLCLAQERKSAERGGGGDRRSLSRTRPDWRSALGLRGVFWRRFVDWAVVHLPGWIREPLLWLGTVIFFFVAGTAREAVATRLRLIRPRSSRPANYFRTLIVFANFGRCLSDAAAYRWKRPHFQCDLEGEEYLNALAHAPNGIVLTAHMGSYDLGAALFAEKFQRAIQMVRAPEPDELSREHFRSGLKESTAGAVTIGYSSDGKSLAFDLLHALRQGQIICIQGDRIIADVARRSVRFLGRETPLPFGPFALAWASDTPIYPLFVIRTGDRRYRIVAREPIVCRGETGPRDEQLSQALQKWAAVLEEIVVKHWDQWFAFTPANESTSD